MNLLDKCISSVISFTKQLMRLWPAKYLFTCKIKTEVLMSRFLMVIGDVDLVMLSNCEFNIILVTCVPIYSTNYVT